MVANSNASTVMALTRCGCRMCRIGWPADCSRPRTKQPENARVARKFTAAVVAVKDSLKFASGFNELTTGMQCLSPEHGRSFVAIQVPVASPFTDQVFAPPKSGRGEK
jgi:hypothetical protein